MVIEAILLVILLVFGTLSMAWFFSANNFMFAGVEDLPNNLENVAFDIDLFLNNTAEELDHVAKVNFKEFKDQVNLDIEEAKDEFEKMVNKVTEAIEFQEMVDIADFLDESAHAFVDAKEGFKTSLSDISDTVTSIDTQIKDFKSLVNTSQNAFGNCVVANTDIGITVLRSYDVM